MLKKAGASEDWTDADGKTCKEFEHGKMTEYMRKLNQARAEEMERQRQAMESQVPSPTSVALAALHPPRLPARSPVPSGRELLSAPFSHSTCTGLVNRN